MILFTLICYSVCITIVVDTLQTIIGKPDFRSDPTTSPVVLPSDLPVQPFPEFETDISRPTRIGPSPGKSEGTQHGT